MTRDLKRGARFVLVAMLIAGSFAVGQSNVDSVREWWVLEVASARSLAPFHGKRVDWVAYSVHLPGQAELQAIRDRVEGRPDHPDRRLLQRFSRRLENGEIEHFTAWIISDTQWRFERREPSGRIIRAYARDDDTAWDASAVRLMVVDRDRPFPAVAESLFDLHSDMLALRYFVYQAAGLRPLRHTEGMRVSHGPGPGQTTLFWFNEGAGKLWEVVVETVAGEPRFRADHYRSDDGSRENVFVFQRRGRFDGIERDLTGLVDWIDSGYEHSRTYELDSVVPIDGSEFPGLAVPSPDELPSRPSDWPDSLEIKLTVSDFRDGRVGQLPAGSVIVVNPDATEPTDRYRQVRSGSGGQPASRNWFPILLGMFGAAAVIVYLVVRIRTRCVS